MTAMQNKSQNLIAADVVPSAGGTTVLTFPVAKAVNSTHRVSQELQSGMNPKSHVLAVKWHIGATPCVEDEDCVVLGNTR